VTAPRPNLGAAIVGLGKVSGGGDAGDGKNCTTRVGQSHSLGCAGGSDGLRRKCQRIRGQAHMRDQPGSDQANHVRTSRRGIGNSDIPRSIAFGGGGEGNLELAARGWQ